MSLPSRPFVVASLKLWRARKARYQRVLKRYQIANQKAMNRIALREKQLKQIDAKPAPGPTVMYDSVTLSAIPADAPAVAGYTSGRFPTFPQIPRRWPNAKHLSIAVSSTHDAECLDVEPGDATPAVAAGWVRRQQARGIKRPVVYCSVSAAPGLLATLAKAGISRSEIRLWTAHYTFREHRCSSACGFGFTGTADATQWTDKALGRNLDQSLVGPGFWA